MNLEIQTGLSAISRWKGRENYMDERQINIFLTNLEEYNNGRLVGEWVQLPCSRERMAEVLERIGVGGKANGYFITDYELPFTNMKGIVGEFANVDELNYLAVRMNKMEEDEWNMFSEIINSAQENCSSVAEYINLTYNLDKFDLLPAKDETEFGIYLCQEFELLPDVYPGVNLSCYIDYEAIGRDAVINSTGGFGINGFVEQIESMEQLYDGFIPEEHRIIRDLSGKESGQPARIQSYDDIEMER